MVQNGSQNGPELTRIDPEYTLPDWSPDDLRYALMTLRSALSHMAVSNRALFSVLLTIADRIRVSSIDWIRPPS